MPLLGLICRSVIVDSRQIRFHKVVCDEGLALANCRFLLGRVYNWNNVELYISMNKIMLQLCHFVNLLDKINKFKI